MRTASAIAYSTMTFYSSSAVIRYLKLPSVWNRGTSFSLFSSTPFWAAAIGLILLSYISFITVKRGNELTRTGMIILWGGALSNLMDRLVHGAVMDYIPIPLWPGGLYINAADIGLIIGSLAVIISLTDIYTHKKERTHKDGSSQ